MLDTYLKLKIIIEYIIPAILLLVFVGIVMYINAKAAIRLREGTKKKLLKKNGFKRDVYDVPSVGGGAYYGWGKGDKYIKERDFGDYTVKELKEWIKKGENNG